MLEFVSKNFQGLKFEFSRRINNFRWDPRWLLQEQCPYSSNTGRGVNDEHQPFIVRGKSYSEFSVNLSSDLLDIGSPRSGDLYAAASGGGDCCPPVVDQYTWLALIAGIALATYFLRIAITTNIMAGRKRRKREDHFSVTGESISRPQ